MRDTPHFSVVYEQDLCNRERHQETLDMLFDYLDVPRVPVRTGLVRTTTDHLGDVVENFDEVAEAVANSPYAYFLRPELLSVKS